MKDEALAQLANKPDRELTHTQREQLGFLFQDGTGTFSSASGAMRSQADFAAAPQKPQAPAGGVRPSQKGLESITVASDTATPGQRRQMQRAEG